MTQPFNTNKMTINKGFTHIHTFISTFLKLFSFNPTSCLFFLNEIDITFHIVIYIECFTILTRSGFSKQIFHMVFESDLSLRYWYDACLGICHLSPGTPQFSRRTNVSSKTCEHKRLQSKHQAARIVTRSPGPSIYTTICHAKNHGEISNISMVFQTISCAMLSVTWNKHD